MLSLIQNKMLAQKIRLTLSMTKAQLKSRYRKTFAGFFWVILNPIITFGVQAIVFKNVLRFNLDNYYLFLLSGLIPWIFLTMSLQMTVGSFINNRQTLLSFNVDAWIFIISQVIDNFINYVITYFLLLSIFQVDIVHHLEVIPLLLLSSFILFMFTFFISSILAIIHVFFRDTQFILQFVINIAYFLTPILYPETTWTTKYQGILQSNPLYVAIRPFHLLMWKYDYQEYLFATGKQIIYCLIFALITWYLWRKKRNDIYLRI